MHASHIFLCGTKVTFLCGKSPKDIGKSHLQNAAFFRFHFNWFITFYICFVTCFTSGTVTLGIYSMRLYHFLEGYYPPPLQHRLFKKNIVSTAVICTHYLHCNSCYSPFLHSSLVLLFQLHIHIHCLVLLHSLWHVDYEYH